jgi:undecaprenyl-diphosphatase
MRETFASVVARVRRWVGGTDLVVLLAVLAVVASLWVFVEVADEVAEGELQHIDEWVLQSLRKPDNRGEAVGPAWLVIVAGDLTALGGYAFIILLTAAVVGYLILAKKYHDVLLVLVAVVGGWLLSTGLKELFDRPRPTVVPALAQVHSASFPSGHSMLSAVVYLTLGTLLSRLVESRRQKLYFITVALFITFLVGLTRVYLGVHYPSDVLAGWTAGLAWAILCWLATRFLQKKHVVEQPRETTEEGK